MQRPTAVPMIPASASGVSTHRSGPNRSRKPAVARKTPPARPTSSPITRTFESCSSSPCRDSLIASTSVRSATPAVALQRAAHLIEVGGKRRQALLVRVVEDERRIGVRLGLRRLDPLAHLLLGLGADGGGHLVGEQAGAAKVA